MKPIDVIDAALDLGGVDAGAAQAEGDVVAHGEPGKRRILLEHHADAVRHLAGDRLVLERDGALGRRAQARDQVQQRGLAAAGRADHREELAARKIEVERPERMHRELALEHARHAAQARVNGGLCGFALRLRDRHAHWVGTRSLGRNEVSTIAFQSGLPFSEPTISMPSAMRSMPL